MSVPILRPWPNQLAPPKQVKPQGIPQIDWSHPLAQGLISYWFDTGMGFYVDLVRGNVTGLGTGSTYPPTDASPYGTAFKFSAGGPNVIQDPAVFFRTSWAAPYAFSVGWFARGATGAGAFPVYAGLLDGPVGNTALGLFKDTANSNNLFLSIINADAISLGTPPTSGFHVASLTTTGASSQDGYLDGALKNSNTLTNSYNNVFIHFVAGGPAVNSTSSTEGPNASVFYFAIWERQLTAAENQLLWTDPYCFLVPAEPEMSQLVLPILGGGVSPSRTILRPWPNQLAPSRKVTPPGVSRIDWSHPLAQGLIGAWVPGISGGVDISDLGPNLTFDTSAVVTPTSDGPGLTSTAANSGMFGTATPAFKSWTEFSIFWRGVLYGVSGTGNCSLAGVSFATPEATPFVIATIIDNPSIAGSLALQWNSGGSFANTAASSVNLSTNAVQTAGATFKAGGNAQLYINGKADVSAAFGASGPTSGATSIVEVGEYHPQAARSMNGTSNVAFFWNRQLSADEMVLLDRDPYCFLVPAEPEMPQLPRPILGGGVTPSRTILRPWPNQLAPPKQVKPQGVPQIDWSHPLTQGMVCYWYDTGLGFYMDLVTGDVSVKGSAATGFAQSDATPFGTGFRFPSSATAGRSVEGSVAFPQQAWVAPYSFAMGIYQLFTPATSTTFWGLTDAANNTPFQFFNSGAVTFAWVGNNLGPNFGISPAPNDGFHAFVGVAVGASSVIGYRDGKQVATSSLATSYTGSAMKLVTNADRVATGATNSVGAAIFFGAAWNRALDLEDSKLLYTDPYCFLIPAEPELQALPYNIGGGIAPPRTILRPWPNQLATPKQVKPQGVPQIDWGHPLAQSLISYWYDTGMGFHMDLVSGEITAPGVGATYPAVDASPYGTGLFFPTNSQQKYMQSPRTFSQQAWAHPYSFAMAIYQDVAPLGGSPEWFAIADTAGNNPLAFYGSTGTNKLFSYFGNGAGTGLDMGALPVAGAFEVFAATTTGASSQLAWRNGVPAAAAGTQTSAYTATATKVVFNSFRLDTSPGCQIGAHVFFGAVWNRQLTDEDARLLWTDPYCLLVPAEPEMTLLAPDVLMPQIWM
jgi:hypothetical protein